MVINFNLIFFFLNKKKNGFEKSKTVITFEHWLTFLKNQNLRVYLIFVFLNSYTLDFQGRQFSYDVIFLFACLHLKIMKIS